MTLTATEAQDPVGTLGPSPGRKRKERGRPRRAQVALWCGAILILLAPLLLVGREIPAPAWLRHRIEAAAADALAGGGIGFEAITLRVPADLHPELRLLGLRLVDREGRLLVRVPEAVVRLSPRGLLFEGRPLVQEIALSGAELSLARAADGSVELSFGAEPTDGATGVGRAQGLISLPDQFEGLFDRPALTALRSVRVDGLVVNYEDARAGRSWTVDGGTLALDIDHDGVRLSGEVAVLSGRSYVSQARLRYESPRGSPAARLSLTVTDVAAVDVASQGPALAWLSVVDAPLSLALRAEIDADGALGPTSVALKMDEGTLRPPGGAAPVGFDLARAYLAYDPVTQSIEFGRLEVRSDWGGVEGSGRAYLRELRAGLPDALLGQFALREVVLAPPGLSSGPIRLTEATAQLRLRLDPFVLEIAEASLTLPGGDDARVTLSGEAAASAEGWRVAVDGQVPELSRDRLLALWPEGLRPGLRSWIEGFLPEGNLRGLSGAVRLAPGQVPVVALTSRFDGLNVQPLPTHPPITNGSGWLTWEDGTLTLALDRGGVEAAEGGRVDLGGTTVAFPPGDAVRSPVAVDLRARGPIVAALSLLDEPPWRFLGSAGLPVALSEGQAELAGRIGLFIGPNTVEELDLDIAARLSDVRSDHIVPGWTLAAESLAVAATLESLEIGGAMRLGSAEVAGTWRMGFAREEMGRSSVEARLGITPEVLREFGIDLPEGAVSGEGRGELRLELAPGERPAFAFRSTLEGLRLRLPEIGWSKPGSATGELLVSGTLGGPATVERLSLSAPGLSAEGDLRLTGAGGFDRLRLRRLRVGDWLDAPVTLTARPGSDVPDVAVEGGTLDLGKATLGGGGSGGGGPLAISLDRLQVTESVALTNFTGELSTVSGLEGTFSGQVNGGPPVVGRVSPQDGRVAARVQGEDAGAVLRAANLFATAEGGALDLLLLPVGPESYAGELWIDGLRVREAPVLASLLNAASGVGLLQQLGGQGIVFDEVSAEFRIDPGSVTVARASAVGAGLGLSLDGMFDTDRLLMDFQGVLSPLYLVNGIGAVLTRPGEGLLGFNFTLAGDPGDPEVGVNPLSVLTPGMFREIFRRPAPSITE